MDFVYIYTDWPRCRWVWRGAVNRHQITMGVPTSRCRDRCTVVGVAACSPRLGTASGAGVALRVPALAWVAVWAGTAGWSCWSRTGWVLRLGVAVRRLAVSAGFRLVAVESPLRPSRRALFCSMGPPRTTANLGGFSGVRVWLGMFLSRGFVVARDLKVCDRICMSFGETPCG